MALVRRPSAISREDGGRNTPGVSTSGRDKNIRSLTRNSSRSSLPDIQTSRREINGTFTRRSSTPSMATPTSGSKRVSFTSVTKRVRNLLKFTMKVKPKVSPIPEVEPPVGGEIRELPKCPRFSSFLSPEAQFALMKGYEDVLHQEISASLPEVRHHLRRNRTPVNTVEIKDAEDETIGATKTCWTEGNNGENSGNTIGIQDAGSEKTTEITKSRWTGRHRQENSGGSLKQLEETQRGLSEITKSRWRERHSEEIPGQSLKQLEETRRSLNARLNLTEIEKPSFQKDSSHHAIPHDRRLALTYRLESAMDILDKMRLQSGSHFISPRLPVDRKEKGGNSSRLPVDIREITPVTEYNCWTSVWRTEFRRGVSSSGTYGQIANYF